ncbi:MAG: U32 family peptidase [Oscillospiraceae bacterium]|nr:U32 family peptidase [Oscillospiraceae bacterium]
MLKKPELLAPAGSFEKAKTAFMYGADAVYMGTSKLSLRTRTGVETPELVKTIEYAHKIGKKVYVALNTYARDNMYEEIKKQAQILNEIKADGVIVSDGGVVEAIKETAPNLEIHISTQANTVSYHSCKFWYNNGAKRVILARELNKEEIKEIMENKPEDLEIEMFIHGAVCYGYSGRCHLSDFLSNRMANLGDCSQSCRWAYNMYIEEKNNPGNMMPIEEDSNGTYILSSKDLCLIKELPEIIEMGTQSLKIEGRLKTEYYLATIINTYRTAIDKCLSDPKEYNSDEYLKELEKTKTRGLTTFYFNDKNNTDFQEYEGKQYSEYGEFGGKIIHKDKELGKDAYVVEIRNKLSLGDTLELIIPGELEPFIFIIEKLWDIETNEDITHVNPGREGQKVKMHIPVECEEGWILRRRKT